MLGVNLNKQSFYFLQVNLQYAATGNLPYFSITIYSTDMSKTLTSKFKEINVLTLSIAISMNLRKQSHHKIHLVVVLELSIISHDIHHNMEFAQLPWTCSFHIFLTTSTILNIYNSMTTGQTSSSDEDHVI